MLSTGNNGSRGGGTLSSDMPPLPQCLPLEPITLSNQKYTRSGELRRVLGVPLGSSSEDHSSGVAHPKPSPPVATEELKHFKESVQDASKKARDRVKKLRESIFKLEKYKEALSSRKRQRSDMSSAERSCGVNLVKMGSQLHRNPLDVMTQKLEERTKGVGLSKRIRTSVADVRADSRAAAAAASRQQMVIEKDVDMLSANTGGSVRIEEKVRRLPAGGEGWETKMKRKRSVAAVSNRVINGDRDIKCALQPKLSTDSKLRSCDTQCLRSKSSPGVSGINKLDGSFDPSNSDASAVPRNESESTPHPKDRSALIEQRVLAKGNNKSSFQDDNPANCSNTILKGKISRAPRTSSIMVLDTSSKAQPSFGDFQGWEQPTNVNKVPALGVANNQKRQIENSSSHAMAQWVGQRPHKNSRTRRANLVSPMPNNVDTHSSPQGFATTDFSGRSSYGNSGSLFASADNAPKIKREVENVSSPFGLSESEESGAGDNKSKEISMDGGEVSASHKMGPLILPMRKNKIVINDNGDTVRRQGRSGNGSSSTRPSINPIRDKLENLQTFRPLQGTRPLFDKNKSKSGRPPSKKLKFCKATTCVMTMVNSVSSDFTGESDDDHEELFAAANSARKASNLACSGLFWKKMESIFVSVSSEDMSYLNQQFGFSEELDEGLSHMFGIGCDIMGVVVKKETAKCSVEKQMSHSNQGSTKINALCEKFDTRRSERVTPLYQRVLSALIEEDESEELFHHSEGKNMSLHYASDDSHCGSCNQIDVDPKDRDRMESEVESNADFHSKNCLLDRLSCDKSIGSNSFKNPSFSNSVHGNELWMGDDDLSHLDVGLVTEICSHDLGHLQSRETNISGFSSSDSQYQLMCLDDRLLLELASIGLYPETLPDLAEGEIINHDVMELKEGLYKQVQRKKKSLGKIDMAIRKSTDMEKRNLEHLAMDQLVEMAYRKRMACRGTNASKARKVLQVALAFVKRTLARCRKFEETGSSCFSEPALQDVMYSAPPCSNDAKSVECVGSGTASNTCNEASNHQKEARGSGAVSSTKRREVLIDDVVGSASSRVTSSLDSPILGVRGKRSEREREQNKDGLGCNLASGSGRKSLDSSFKSERKTKAKPKQRTNNLSTQAGGQSTFVSEQSTVVNTSDLTVNAIPSPAKEADDSIDFANLQLPEFASMDELGVSNELGGPQDLSNWLNFDEDGLQDHDSIGLEIPMDDLSELNMLM